MRYKLPTDRLINQLVPYYLSGRNYILMLQSLVYPLVKISIEFESFARQKHIEARMTSQVIYFEWFLNIKFRHFFTDKNEKIFISESESLGVDIYHEGANYSRPFTVWKQNEEIITSNPQEEPRELFSITEEHTINNVSFTVNVPALLVTEREFVYMLSYEVNRYRTAGKTYNIKISK